jgi:hypothetical protein
VTIDRKFEHQIGLRAIIDGLRSKLPNPIYSRAAFTLLLIPIRYYSTYVRRYGWGSQLRQFG